MMRRIVIGFKKGFRRFGENIAIVVNSMLLLIVYFLGIGPTAIIARIVGKEFLTTQTNDDQESYWEDLKLGTRPHNDYYRQF